MKPLADIVLTQIAQTELAGVFETLPLICDVKLCLVERDGVVVYSDQDHLARGFVLLHTDDVEAFVKAALDVGK